MAADRYPLYKYHIIIAPSDYSDNSTPSKQCICQISAFHQNVYYVMCQLYSLYGLESFDFFGSMNLS